MIQICLWDLNEFGFKIYLTSVNIYIYKSWMTSFYLTFDYFHVNLKFVVHKVRTLVMLLLKFHGFTVKGTQYTHS